MMNDPDSKTLVTMKTRQLYMDKVNPPDGEKLELNMGEVLIMVVELLCDIRDLALASFQSAQRAEATQEMLLRQQLTKGLGDLRG